MITQSNNAVASKCCALYSFMMHTSRSPQTTVRSMLVDTLPLLQFISAIFMIWKGLSLLADTPFPIMVVTTESMEPAFQPGDVLFIANHKRNVHVGELPVCWFQERQFPMIHRIIQVVNREHEDPGSRYVPVSIGPNDLQDANFGRVSRQLILTKGDNNALDDKLLYPEGQEYIYRSQIIGFVRAYIPFLGWPAIVLQDPTRLRGLTRMLGRATGLIQ